MILVLLVTWLSACSGKYSNGSNPTGELGSPAPILISTSSPTSSPTASPSQTPTFVNLPTPTPILYTVVQNDNLTNIANKYNITLEELLAANPKVSSQTLTVGTVLTIPTGQESSSPPISTPVPVAIQQLQCFPNQDGSLYCLVLVKNDHPETVQNLTVLIDLEASNGTIINSQTAYSPLDLLPPGKVMPLGVLFAAPVPPGWQPQARLISASRLASVEPQYPSISLLNSLVEVDWGGLNAHITGEATLTASDLKASRVWILGVAYDQGGNVIGFRRWESKNTISPGDQLPFDFMVASLGPQIDHVDLLVEAAR